jgi:L-rhamnose mutarotase
MGTFKRYCKTIELSDDPESIEAYKKLHAIGSARPEITEGMKSIGIFDMEIYISGTHLFMIMETVPDFDHDRAMSKLAILLRQTEWEALVSKYQMSDPNSSAKEKWHLMERIYKMDQNREIPYEAGYPQER